MSPSACVGTLHWSAGSAALALVWRRRAYIVEARDALEWIVRDDSGDALGYLAVLLVRGHVLTAFARYSGALL